MESQYDHRERQADDYPFGVVVACNLLLALFFAAELAVALHVWFINGALARGIMGVASLVWAFLAVVCWTTQDSSGKSLALKFKVIVTVVAVCSIIGTFSSSRPELVLWMNVALSLGFLTESLFGPPRNRRG